jgi:ATP-dependent exoDNAse (exonuclease V) beta subunit
VLDLTALTRALLHPADRVAALAILRAPWCGLSLADLHTLTGADDPALQDYSIQCLMAERGHLLPDESCQRLARVWTVLQSAAAQRSRLTPAQLVERAWRSLGGDAWLTGQELTNINRFFQLLDELQLQLEVNSSAGLLDTTLLEERLEKLYAEPASFPSDQPFVELLTIHKAKGLEWDVVFVPALERGPGRSPTRLLTWSEIDAPDAAEPSEDRPGDGAAHIMLAPIAGRGEPSKALNNWLNGIHRAREAAERKRLLYVACTRAREELHLFAAPGISTKGEIHPHYDSLLEAAWPAAEPHFAAHLSQNATEPEPFDLDLAAAAVPSHPTLQRLPLAFDPATRIVEARAHKLPYGDPDDATGSSQTQFSRPEGSLAARSFGNAVHAALEALADRIATGHTPASLLAELPAWIPRIAALLRADSLPPAIVNRLAREARAALETTLRDRDGLWLLAPNSCAASELALTAWPEPHNPGDQAPIRPTSIRIDRIFRAGPEPQIPGEEILWIVDYKTATHGISGLDDFLAAQRVTYAPQLETYARILTQLPHPPDRPAPKEVRLALYYPILPRLLWWPLANSPV